MTMKTVFRIHPTINFARLGTSDEFYLSPETSAGLPLAGTATTGGLPIKAGTESEFIDSEDLRDAGGTLNGRARAFASLPMTSTVRTPIRAGAAWRSFQGGFRTDACSKKSSGQYTWPTRRLAPT
jgi:hypothetical protein